MAKPIEPPILMSRVLAFVLASSVVVLGAMVFTLLKMIPLERPQVFFLLTPTRSANVVIEPLSPDSTNKLAKENYIKGFIREYVIARNTLNPNATISKSNWSQVVKPWSSSDVFANFVNTTLYKEYTFSEQAPKLTCSVNFSNSAKESPIVQTGSDTYHVNFIWFCENIGGQATQKNYKIRIRIQSDLDTSADGVFDNLEKLSVNPLGIQVVQYTVLDDRGNPVTKGDPLDSDIASWARI